MNKKNVNFNLILKKYYWYIFSFLVLLLAFLCFFKLGTYPVYDWDEARHGTNAYEMMQNKNYIANYYGGSLDYWNLKPPLSYYLIIVGYKIFGYNAWGLRFFSALFYVLLAVVVAMYIKKKVGLFPSLVSILFFCGGYVFLFSHFARSGDADSAFVFCFAIGFIALESSSKKPYFLCITGLMFALCFLLKSWHALFFLPIIFFYYLFTKQYKILKFIHYFTAILSALTPIFIWAILRYNFDGITFFKCMIEYDLLKRSGESIEGHNGYPFYYTIRFVINFVELFCLVICTWGYILKIKSKQKLSNLEKLCLISFFSVFIIYAVANSKLGWYIYPCCIPLFVGAANFLPNVFSSIRAKKLMVNIYKLSCFIVIILCVSLSFMSVQKQQTTNNLQQFVYTLNIKNCNLYYKDSVSKKPYQSFVLCTQWHTGITTKTGDFEDFLNDPNSYIVLSTQYYSSLQSIPENIQIIQQSHGYVLCFNAV